MPLEFRAGVLLNSSNDNVVEDGAFVTTAIDNFQNNADLPDWRTHSANQNLILDDIKLSKISIDKVTQFGLRPPEFRGLFNMLGNYPAEGRIFLSRTCG